MRVSTCLHESGQWRARQGAQGGYGTSIYQTGVRRDNEVPSCAFPACTQANHDRGRLGSTHDATCGNFTVNYTINSIGITVLYWYCTTVL